MGLVNHVVFREPITPQRPSTPTPAVRVESRCGQFACGPARHHIVAKCRREEEVDAVAFRWVRVPVVHSSLYHPTPPPLIHPLYYATQKFDIEPISEAVVFDPGGIRSMLNQFRRSFEASKRVEPRVRPSDLRHTK
ncbi:hypothetical protein EVAR_4703_1 [Eumeta japonica]|uniref:Uncharacterized protein n=1 Tax=Eumeta variegata TaxID=151549 RepID=A0A4C1WNI4_EUMVA|nr:hypothetical protein EVAR_4703_1 [Eumeta japonica]